MDPRHQKELTESVIIRMIEDVTFRRSTDDFQQQLNADTRIRTQNLAADKSRSLYSVDTVQNKKHLSDKVPNWPDWQIGRNNSITKHIKAALKKCIAKSI